MSKSIPSKIPVYVKAVRMFYDPIRATDYITTQFANGDDEFVGLIYKGYYVVAYSADSFGRTVEAMINALPKYAESARGCVEKNRIPWGVPCTTAEAMRRIRVQIISTEGPKELKSCMVGFTFEGNLFSHGHIVEVNGDPYGDEFRAHLF